MIWLAVVLALLSAVTVGFSTSLQHHVASGVSDATGEVGLIGVVMRRPLWWLGQLLGFVALIFHTLALAFGPIALIQPIAIMGMVFGPPIRHAMSRKWLPRPEAIAVVVTFVGLIAFLVASAPSPSNVTGGIGVMTVIGGCVVMALILVALAYQVPASALRGTLLGSAAGLLFGSVAVCLKIVVHTFDDHGLVAALTAPATWLCVALGLSGIAINQFSYRAARLSATMPALNIVNAAVAVLVGYVVFQETPRLTPLALAFEVAGIAAICWGLYTLARFEEEQEAPSTAQSVADHA